MIGHRAGDAPRRVPVSGGADTTMVRPADTTMVRSADTDVVRSADTREVRSDGRLTRGAGGVGRRAGRLAVVGVLAAVASGLAACGSGGSGTVTVSAVFSDVSSLTTGASVQLADINVGSVTGIALDHGQAKVTMAVQRSARVPSNVTAELEQPTILGQYVVALVPRGSGGGMLRDGERLAHAKVVPGIQQLVQSGTAVFGAVNAAQLSEIIGNSAQAYGGQAARIKVLLDDFGTVLAGYASQSGQITTLIDQLNRFTGTLAPDAGANAQALANLAQTSTTLAQQSNQFIALLQSLDALATQGRSILDSGLPQVEDQLNALAALASQLASHQQQLATLLQEVPAANHNLAAASYQGNLQVLNNLIVCGVPGLGGGSAATNRCPAGSGP